MKMTIKTGDNVLVIAGKDKGKTGKVSAVIVDSNKVVVDGVNIITKHKKPRTQQDKGGIIKKSAPIEASNVLVICPVCGKATRVVHAEIDGKKVRSCKKCGASLDKEYVKQTKKEAIKASELKGASLKATKKAEKVEEVKEVTEEASEKSASKAKTSAKSTTAKKATSKTASAKEETKSASKSTSKAKTSASKEAKEEKPVKKTTAKTSKAKSAEGESETKKTTKKVDSI